MVGDVALYQPSALDLVPCQLNREDGHIRRKSLDCRLAGSYGTRQYSLASSPLAPRTNPVAVILPRQ
jgi:hypothetical protein